jgi:hypothetical protein
MPLSPAVMALFNRAKASFVGRYGTESDFNNIINQISGNSFTSSRLNDAYDLGLLTSISFVPNSPNHLAYYQASTSLRA